ncbi:VOC family protein [Rhodococcus opacus]|nr:VOC family protein [Rhodococcus opacus]
MATNIPYHSGILVRDLDEAMKHFADTLGYTFNPPTSVRVHELEDRIAGTTGPGKARVTYSRQGPFRLELIEFTGNGIYGADLGEGLHHLGVWEPDPEARLRELEEAGKSVDAIFRRPDGTVSVIYAGPVDVSGVRIEYVNAAQRERLEHWFDTGELR